MLSVEAAQELAYPVELLLPMVLELWHLLRWELQPYILSKTTGSIPFGNNKSLVGEVKNNSPFDMNNIVLYASAHSTNGTQIDSVKSTRFPIIKAGQTLKFSAFPNQYIKSEIYYDGCVGADLQDAMSYRLLKLDRNRLSAINLQALP